MLSKEYRLTTALFQKTFEKGSVFSTEHFLLRILNSLPATGTHSRFAVVVSKKLGKTAVIRNRNRRIIYTALAGLLQEKKQGISTAHILIFLKNNIDQCTIEQIQRELTAVLEKTKVLA